MNSQTQPAAASVPLGLPAGEGQRFFDIAKDTPFIIEHTIHLWSVAAAEMLNTFSDDFESLLEAARERSHESLSGLFPSGAFDEYEPDEFPGGYVAEHWEDNGLFGVALGILAPVRRHRSETEYGYTWRCCNVGWVYGPTYAAAVEQAHQLAKRWAEEDLAEWRANA